MPYRVASPVSLNHAKEAWIGARISGQCLVLLPPVTPTESAALLAHLPKAPPPSAVIAVFTSGSEGNPKAVFHSEASLQGSTAQVAKWLEAEAGILLTLSPWSMAGFLLGVVLAESFDTKVYTLSDSPLFSGHEVVPLVEKGSVTKVITHPYHLKIFQERNMWAGLQETGLTVTSFTAPTPQGMRERADEQGIVVEVGYGLSEAAGPVLVEGKTLGAELLLSTEGELYLKGLQLMLGYAQGGDFLPLENPFPTGDIFITALGCLEWTHRVREVIDVAGRKVAPSYIEKIVLDFLQAGDCLAYPVADEVYGQRVALLVEAEEINQDEFQRFLTTAFSPELRPKEWTLVDELPRLPSGKKNRKFSWS